MKNTKRIHGPGSLMMYRHFPEEQILTGMLTIASDKSEADPSLVSEVVKDLTELAMRYGLSGNLWHAYLAYGLANHENAFSRACEISEPADGSLKLLAMQDFALIREWMKLDLSVIRSWDEDGDPSDFSPSAAALGTIQNFSLPKRDAYLFNHRVRDRIAELARHMAEASTEEEFFEKVTDFYRDFGVGKFGLHKAFRIVHEEGKEADIEPITCTEHVSFDQLIGYETQKQKLVENTENFIFGRPCNNCLLFGDAGTGKSSSIKAILNQYYDQGLRMIEVYKHQFKDLAVALNQAKNRNYRFIIYMDDLSFEEFEIEYKYLKAVIEGGLERRPENVLIYATSNRRHLIKESFNDRPGLSDDKNLTDTVQEKLSLVSRFGVTIYYGKPDKRDFQQIVKELAEQEEIQISDEELFAEANKWELSHGGRSGRTAAQFIRMVKAAQVKRETEN